MHERVQDILPRTYSGLIDAFREIIPVLMRQSKDPNCFILREIQGDSASETIAPRGLQSAGVVATLGPHMPETVITRHAGR